MADQIIAYDLGHVIDTGIIEQIHRTVVSALERDLYRTYVGRFRFSDAQGEFNVGNYAEGKRVLILPDAVKRYELHLELQNEKVPGAAESVDNVGIIYDVAVIDKIIKRGFEVSFHYPCNPGDKSGAGALDLFGFNLNHAKMSYHKPQKGTISRKTLEWIYD